MKKELFIILMFISIVHIGWTQTDGHQISSVPNTSQFEILQSDLGARLTFKLDKHTGIVYQLVTGDSGLTWEMMYIENYVLNQSDVKVRCQIFTSGIGIRYTFLLNVNNGATWQLVEDIDDKSLFWKPIE